jgi:hypothetical protein
MSTLVLSLIALAIAWWWLAFIVFFAVGKFLEGNARTLSQIP